MLAWHVVNKDFTLNHDLSNMRVYKGLELTYTGEIELCQSGLHACVCLLDALSYGASSVICRVEVGEEYIESYDKLVSNYRKVLQVADCEKIILEFAIYVAEDVLHIFEEKYPNDNRPRKAIETAKQRLNGKMAAGGFYAADADAGAAACAADADAGAAYDAAAYAAARAAAYDADADAAYDAAYDAARAADAGAAYAAARAAAYAADAAARAAAYAADADAYADAAYADAAYAAACAAAAARAADAGAYKEYNTVLEKIVLDYMGAY